MTFNKSHDSLLKIRTRTLTFYFLTLLLYGEEKEEGWSENEIEGIERGKER